MLLNSLTLEMNPALMASFFQVKIGLTVQMLTDKNRGADE